MPLDRSEQADKKTTLHYRACHLCEAICGLKIEVEADKIVSIKGDENDPLSRGHICPKAIALQDIHEDPDRLRKPLKRIRKKETKSEDDTWQEIEWDEAFDITVNQILKIREQFGADSLGAYFGNPSVHNFGMLTHQRAFFGNLKTKNRFSATSVDQLPHHLTSMWMFGHKDLFPIGDIDHTDFFLIIGGNPIASNGSIMTVPDIRKRLKAIQKRGGKVVTVDPRKTETAELADEHIFIKPGTDALLLIAILKEIFDSGLSRLDQYGEMIQGLEVVEKSIQSFSIEQAADKTGIAAATIKSLAHDFAKAQSGICYGRMGVSVQQFGALNQWLVQLINIVTGNLDRKGGVLFTHPAFDSVATTKPGSFNRFQSRISKRPEFSGELPAATMAEEILTEGEGQIRAMFTGAGNPVLSTPNGKQLDKAFSTLEFMVSLDPYLNETTRHADVILPPVSPLETDHYDIAFHLNAVRNTARYNPAIFEKPEDGKYDWEIFNELGKRVAEKLDTRPPQDMSPKDMVAFAIAMGPYGPQKNPETALTMEKLEANPSGIDLGPLRSDLSNKLKTEDGKVHCAIPELINDLDRVQSTFKETIEADALLIGRRHLRSNNSWMHNYQRLVKGKSRCTLMIHPEDIAKLNFQGAEKLKVKSRVGVVIADVEVTEEIMPGVVSIPHGFGHNRKGTKTKIAEANSGVSVNDLTDEQFYDELSGNAAVNGVPVKLELA